MKFFRAFDGEKYWYSDENLFFLYEYNHKSLQEAPFEMKDLEQYIGKTDINGAKIFENDVLVNEFDDPNKFFQVVWSHQHCGYRKVPLGNDTPETPIDTAFMEVKGTIHSEQEE